MPRKKATKEPVKSGGPIKGYGKEILLQIPVGRRQTRTLTLRQARYAFMSLSQLRHLFK